MAYKLIRTDYDVDPKTRRHEYVLDSADDVSSLPKCAPGSVAIVADKGGAIYMVNASGEWKEQ